MSNRSPTSLTAFNTADRVTERQLTEAAGIPVRARMRRRKLIGKLLARGHIREDGFSIVRGTPRTMYRRGTGGA